MANLTMADAASRTLKKGWVQRSDEEDAQIEAQTAREQAAKVTGRKRRSPLYAAEAEKD